MRELALAAQRLRNPSTVTWTWVPRAQNGHADRLLNEVLDGGSRAAAAGAVAVQPAPPRPMMRPASLGEPSTLFVVRHGDTPLTEGRRFSGRGGLDPGLTEGGRAQAAHAAAVLEARLAGAPLAAVLVSPLLRTRETAEVIAARLDVPVEVEDGFAEMAFGEWDGLSFGEARARDAEYFDRWLLDPHLSPPGGESLASLRERVRDAQQRTIARFPGERVLVVAHAMPVKVLVADALDAPLESAHRVEVAPASVAEISYWSDGRPMIRALGLR
jgi:probable phosphoglycerate mutase